MSTTTHTASISGRDQFDAAARFERVVARWGLPLTLERVEERSFRHLLWTVVFTMDASADRDRVWVLLTSFGISPDQIGSRWEGVPGVG